MALFKSLRGKRENLPSIKTDGYAYFCVDDGTFWIDYKDQNGVVQRKQLNAKDAETLMGASLSTVLNDNEVEIPTSKAVLDAINSIDIPTKTSDLTNDNIVQYTEQILTDDQKSQARTNIGAQQKIYNLKLEDPIVENQSISDNFTFTFPSAITLVEGSLYLADIQFMWADDGIIDRYQVISKAATSGSAITVSWNGTEIVLSTTGITTANVGGSIVITLARVISYEPAFDIQLMHQEGTGCIASGIDAHVEGYHSNASGCNAHAEGSETTASDYNAHAEGSKTIASGDTSHSEGYSTTASGEFSHAEGSFTIASDSCAHAEGHNTSALDECAHAEGKLTMASGWCSHAEGRETTASGRYSHTEGYNTIATGDQQHVEGKYNEKDIINKYAHIVGNGTSDTKRSNAHTLDWDGNAWFAGKISVGTIIDTPTPFYANDLVTKKYVDNKFATKSVTIASDSWTGTESPYSQQVTVDGVTANSQVNLNPTGDQLNSLATNRTILNTANDNGTVTVYAVGNKPIEDYTMQVTITEV